MKHLDLVLETSLISVAALTVAYAYVLMSSIQIVVK